MFNLLNNEVIKFRIKILEYDANYEKEYKLWFGLYINLHIFKYPLNSYQSSSKEHEKDIILYRKYRDEIKFAFNLVNILDTQNESLSRNLSEKEK